MVTNIHTPNPPIMAQLGLRPDARFSMANNIHVQLCIDPYPPIIGYENFIWGNHAYMINFIEPYPQAPPLNKYDLKRFFFDDGDPSNTESGVFYYWKRKYKYIMSRWGYSVNVAAIEPFPTSAISMTS